VARKRSNYKQLAEALDEAARNGNPVRDVLLANGYSQSVANQGWDAVPNRALKLMKGQSKGKRLRELGKSLDPKEQAALVIGGLINNIQEGTDNAIQSLKALGNTRDIGMFQQEMQTGVVIINVPQSAIDRKAEILNAAEED
jgi:hypothetical protein